MKNSKINRRTFVKNSALLSSSFYFSPHLRHKLPSRGKSDQHLQPVRLHFLEEQGLKGNTGVTWGVPWTKGSLVELHDFSIQDDKGRRQPVQSWPLAFWPDGSLKWTGHAAPPLEGFEGNVFLTREKAKSEREKLTVQETDRHIQINTGRIRCRFNKSGLNIIESIYRDGKILLETGKLVMIRQEGAEEYTASPQSELFRGKIGSIMVEQDGPIRAVVKVEGIHVGENQRGLVPFIVRIYLYAGSDSIRMVHTIVYDGEENSDFIKGLGFRFEVPLSDELHDRHIRFAGDDKGVFGESVRGLTGLRRDPGKTVRNAQLDGKKTPSLSKFPENVASGLKYIPAFGDYSLSQLHPDGFAIKKRTGRGHAWLKSGFGHRSRGCGYIGGPDGGIVFGIRNFWQSYPAQLDIRNAHTEKGEVTLWLWSPEASAMDLQFYHDGLGLDTHEEQLKALNITYEDYEPGFGTAEGVARTSEMNLWILSQTPEREEFDEMAQNVQHPLLLVADPTYIRETEAFGKLWDLPVHEHPKSLQIESYLEKYFQIYKDQVENHRWYGFWDYGDFMHTYDRDRHTWRYDVGGYAWDNSELSTDLWLWYFFLRTGRADVFRMAEAMIRHTGEVDVHHLGPFAPLGSRHNVQHWGCSAKQLRISTAINRRYYYYLTADERVGDLMREQVNAVETLKQVPPLRKVATEELWKTVDPKKVYVSFGTDWGAIAAAWFIEWERTADPGIKTKLMNSMRSIAQQPRGFFSSGSHLNTETGEFDLVDHDNAAASHLSAAFGLVEICEELVGLIELPDFKEAWLDYCTLYNADAVTQRKALGRDLGKLNLGQGHARLTAYSAYMKEDKELAARAWREFFGGAAGYPFSSPETRRVTGTDVLRPTEEADVSTNATAQWGLAAIQCLALVGSHLK